MISFYYYNNTGWEGGLIFQNQKLGWEGGRNPIIFQNTKFPKNTTVTTVADSPWTVRQSPSPVPDCQDREFKLPRSTAKVLQSTTQHYAALRNTTKYYRILQCTTKDYKALKNTTKQPLLLMTSSAR